jgi:hypothetical protein
MATSEFWQRVSASVTSPSHWVTDTGAAPARRSEGKVQFWMLLDFLTVFVSAAIATILGRQITPVAGARYLYHGTLFYGRSMWILLALLCGFALALVVSSKRLNLYNPTRLGSFRSGVVEKACGIAEDVAAKSEAIEDLGVVAMQIFASEFEGVSAVNDGEIVFEIDVVEAFSGARSKEEGLSETE